jgi:hypothetical protein
MEWSAGGHRQANFVQTITTVQRSEEQNRQQQENHEELFLLQQIQKEKTRQCGREYGRRSNTNVQHND